MRAYLIRIDIFKEGAGEDGGPLCTYRWPAVPRPGDRIAVHGSKKSWEVAEVNWGPFVRGDGTPVDGDASVYLVVREPETVALCVTVEPEPPTLDID
jgi:hypothetical protein